MPEKSASSSGAAGPQAPLGAAAAVNATASLGSDIGGAKANARVNFAKAKLLMVQAPRSDILKRIITGFGFRDLTSVHSAEAAWEQIENTIFDLIVCDGSVGQGEIFEFVSDLRRRAPEPNRYCSVILLVGHTPRRFVERARDCGSNMVVAKPLRADVLLDRIVWIATAQRNFLETDSYCGPDRRFRDDGPPAGAIGRRKEDAPSEAPGRSGDQDMLI